MQDGMKEQPGPMIEKLSVLIEGNFLKALHKYENIVS
ncbi:hypothetical protein ACFSQ7_42140 [Paenibacillus rhizoplanae]